MTKSEELQGRVLTARAAGLSYAQIAQTVDGVSSPKRAAELLRAALDNQLALGALSGSDRARLVEVELTHLGSVQRAVEGVMRRGAADPGKGDSLVLRSSRVLLELAEVRHLLLGLQAPAQADQAEDELSRRRRQLHSRRAG